MTIPQYKPFEYNGITILDARRSWKDQNQKQTGALPSIQDDQPMLQEADAHKPVSKQADTLSDPVQMVRSPAVLLMPSATQQSKETVPSTPKAKRRSPSLCSERSDSLCLSERSSQQSATPREQPQPLYSVLLGVPYVKNAMLISNFNDSCCWLPLSGSGAAVDDWVLSADGSQISSATLNKKGKASGAGVGGPVESSGGIRFRPGKSYIYIP